MNQKVYDALMKAGRPEAACRKAAEAAAAAAAASGDVP